MANLNKIRALCETKKIHITELAKKCGITPQSVHDAINRNSTKTEYLEKMAEALGVPISYFFDEFETIPDAKDSEIIELQRKYIATLETLLKARGIHIKKAG